MKETTNAPIRDPVYILVYFFVFYHIQPIYLLSLINLTRLLSIKAPRKDSTISVASELRRPIPRLFRFQ